MPVDQPPVPDCHSASFDVDAPRESVAPRSPSLDECSAPREVVDIHRPTPGNTAYYRYPPLPPPPAYRFPSLEPPSPDTILSPPLSTPSPPVASPAPVPAAPHLDPAAEHESSRAQEAARYWHQQPPRIYEGHHFRTSEDDDVVARLSCDPDCFEPPSPILSHASLEPGTPPSPLHPLALLPPRPSSPEPVYTHAHYTTEYACSLSSILSDSSPAVSSSSTGNASLTTAPSQTPLAAETVYKNADEPTAATLQIDESYELPPFNVERIIARCLEEQREMKVYMQWQEERKARRAAEKQAEQTSASFGARKGGKGRAGPKGKGKKGKGSDEPPKPTFTLRREFAQMMDGADDEDDENARPAKRTNDTWTQRVDILTQDVCIKFFTAHHVVCAGCDQEIVTDMRCDFYFRSLWGKHRFSKCAGIAGWAHSPPSAKDMETWQRRRDACAKFLKQEYAKVLKKGGPSDCVCLELGLEVERVTKYKEEHAKRVEKGAASKVVVYDE
ncbi:hypothetical protein HDZ31DRAFT_73763 [Schizophyllum fasciatum]